MTGGDEAFELVGDLSPAELARRLGWSPRLVRELIDEGAAVRTDAGWHIDTTALSRRWAHAQWDSAGERPADDTENDTENDTDGEP